MIKKLSLVAMMIFAGSMLSACSDMDDLEAWCQTQRKQAPSAIEPLPQIKTFIPMKFEPKTDRMPFVMPQPEILKVQSIKPLNCEQPDRERPMEELEQFALDNLFMVNSTRISSFSFDNSKMLSSIYLETSCRSLKFLLFLWIRIR